LRIVLSTNYNDNFFDEKCKPCYDETNSERRSISVQNEQIARAQLHLITNGRQSLDDVSGRFRSLSDEAIGAFDVLHIREKHRPAREQTEWFRALRTLLPDKAIFINDRLDAAWAVHADGVQLAWHSLPPEQARLLLPIISVIGCSVHSPEEALAAQLGGADYVLFGHVYQTTSKEGLPARGLAALQETVQAVSIPVIAIGGITANRVPDVLNTGCAGVAVMSAFFEAPDATAELLTFRRALDGC
jgi:thiazole tautomerase (transcriptional regulator TenI)